MEWSAIARVRRRDVDLAAKTIHAHGTKNTHRDRTCSATEDWAWKIVADRSRTLLPDALLVGAPHKDVIKAHHAARTTLGLPKTGLHSHRDHYAVMLRRRGVADPIISSQLGHADTRLVQTRYGKYKPTPAEVTRAAGGIGENNVAGTRKHTRKHTTVFG
jgi:integrase